MIFVNGAKKPEGFPPFTKITPAERRCRELIADESCLQDSDLIFYNTLSYTPDRAFVAVQRASAFPVEPAGEWVATQPCGFVNPGPNALLPLQTLRKGHGTVWISDLLRKP